MVTRLTIEHIVSEAERQRGKPMIAGTGITVQDIVDSFHNSLVPEQIANEYDLTLAQVYAALSFYFDHKSEIDASIEADKVQAQTQLEELKQNGLAVSFEELRQRLEKR